MDDQQEREMSQPVIDSTVFNELKETAGTDFVVELVDTFLEEAPGLLAEMQRAFASGDRPALKRAAHSLKSNASTFGAMPLAALARAVELGDAPSTAALQAVADAYALAAAALKEMQRG
jgi:HPt (histidine-containing phosphotransfer) domain-containing protein